MYTCPENDIHSIYVDDELPLNCVAEYEAHIQICKKCAEKLKKFQALKAAFKTDNDSFNLTQKDIDSSFGRLQARLSYNKIVKQGYAKKFPKTKTTIKYVASGLVAAVAIAVVIPRTKTTPIQNPTNFEPVARTSISPTTNMVSTNGTIDASALNTILAADNNEQDYWTIPTSTNQPGIIGDNHHIRRTRKPSLTNYDVFYPQENNFRKSFNTSDSSFNQASFDVVNFNLGN